MNIYDAVNIKQANIDAITGETLSHEAVYDRIIDYLGGLTAIAAYIPFSINEIRKALKTDKHLNSLSLKKWDSAVGFTTCGPDAKPTFGGLWDLYRANGITSASLATGVCILKQAARRIAELSDDEAKEIYANSSTKFTHQSTQ